MNEARLLPVVVEIERHTAEAGWDRPPTLFALVPTAALVKTEPELAISLGLSDHEIAPGDLTPIEQEPLGDEPVDDVLGRITWPPEVLGCALVQEVLVLPPSAEAERPADTDPVEWAQAHPDRREVRLVVGALRDGTTTAVLRLRGADGQDHAENGLDDELAYGSDLAPAVTAALLSTLD